MDEPCSALDPIATGRIEELIEGLKTQYTIVIVTHNLQQAARVSDHTAFFWLGKLVEFSSTIDMFTAPKTVAHRRLRDRPLRISTTPDSTFPVGRVFRPGTVETAILPRRV